MANSTEFEYPVRALSGKVDKNSNKYHRKQYGKMRTVTLNNPRTRDKASPHEKAYRQSFGALQAEKSRIYRDPILVQPYKEKFEHQTEEGNLVLTGRKKIYVKLDGFILACLMNARM